MTLRLILMRHAKSDWNTSAADDFDRPLNKRGQNSATAIGRWLAGREYFPERIICSAAKRTRETCARIVAELPGRPAIRFNRSLYLASAEAMFQTLCAQEDANTLMLIGHNPGTGVLAQALSKAPPQHDRFRDYPTAATTVLEFQASRWKDIAANQGRILDFVVPRDLADAAR